MPNVLLEEGQELAMKALKKGTVMSLIGCSTVFIAGYVIVRILAEHLVFCEMFYLLCLLLNVVIYASSIY